MKVIALKPAALKQLARLGPVEARRVKAKIEDYAAGRSVDVTAMKGVAGAHRIRIGDWRVIFEETETTIIVTRVGHRSSIYD